MNDSLDKFLREKSACVGFEHLTWLNAEHHDACVSNNLAEYAGVVSHLRRPLLSEVGFVAHYSYPCEEHTAAR